ncbi:GRAM-domain-containing protein [Hymenopellis radicata]|nr:GRAM-domain-containing protein [Hymenopellis radicata]
MGSSEFSPKSKASKKRGSSVHSDHSEYFPENPAITSTDYYLGLEDDSSDEDDDSDDDDVLLDLDLAGNEIPVTGFAVASSRRNADFHELFPTIPEGDYLIEDYGCALQREILIQGRLYISENHICFHANIFGWITDLSIPIYEITSLEKKMTAFVIPNAIQITTRQNKYSFTSFLSRDTTFDVIYNIWRLARPEDANSIGSGSGAARSMDQIVEGTIIGSGRDGQVVVGGTQVGSMKKRTTTCQCGKEEKHYSEKALDMIVPGTPEKIYGLMFASGFMKDFMVADQKLLDIQVSDWAPIQAESKLLARNMSYIKPLNGAVGPKQTKCEIRDETEHCDFEDYISTVTTTRTPDVPSGGVFSVKTRTCIMWASQMSTKVVVTTQVEWTGRSFIKGIIERSAIDGQKVYVTALEKAMRGYIKDHQTEFVPEGVDPAAIAPEDVAAAANPDEAAEPDLKQLEHERNQRAFQWAWDTFEGTMSVARQSVKTALELIREAWDQSSSTTILYFIIVFLVISNIYTLIRMGKKEELGRRKALKTTDDNEKWIHGVVTALWDELAAGKGVPGALGYRLCTVVRPRCRGIRESLTRGILGRRSS